MEKHKWQKVLCRKSLSQPSPRWGHACTSSGQQIILFGGYADSNYMNDLWVFNTKDMTWSHCNTTGSVPLPRSNATLHFDSRNHRLVLFGGGGLNKIRFNDVHVLDWETKEWTLLRPQETEKNPWERTYHSSELLYPFLIIFGGEGIADLDDLWAFNLETSQWIQLAKQCKEERPCSRRFHSSALIDSTLFIIAGCHDKYRCLCDVYSIDLSPFLATQQTNLQWKQLKLKNCSFLTRWGHTSAVFDKKVYIFGGRFSNDLQDMLVLDPSKESIKVMKVQGDVPKARRRHSATFVGSSLLVFGGFNGQYFNDLNYISVYELGLKQEQENEARSIQWVNNPFLADHIVTTKDHQSFYIHKGLVSNKLVDRFQIRQFLEEIEGMFTSQQLQELFQILYSGVGTIRQQYLLQRFQFSLFQTSTDRDNFIRKSIKPDCIEQGSLVHKNASPSRILAIPNQDYILYLQNQRTNHYHDLILILNEEYYLPVNRALLASSCPYFHNLMKWSKKQHMGIDLQQELADVRVFQTMINYIQTGFLIIPDDLDDNYWIILLQLAQYFCLHQLFRICENELIGKINRDNCESLLEFGLANRLDELSLHSGECYFKVLLENGQIYQKKGKPKKASKDRMLDYYKSLFQFDLLQLQLKKNPNLPTLKAQGPSIGQKQNHSSIPN